MNINCFNLDHINFASFSVIDTCQFIHISTFLHYLFTSYEYTLAREYNWNVKNKTFKGYEETYFIIFKEDGVYYNELETRFV